MLADYYIFLDVNDLKMCVVPREFIKIKKAEAASVTASCDPSPEHFVSLPSVKIQTSFFELKNQWVSSFLESV
jgi:hypothetical protein